MAKPFHWLNVDIKPSTPRMPPKKITCDIVKCLNAYNTFMEKLVVCFVKPKNKQC